jgi:hypothetical protein
MPDKYITPQNQVLPLIVVAIKGNDGIWVEYGRSYNPETITRLTGALYNTPTYKDRKRVNVFEITEGDDAYIEESLDCLNAPTPHI